MPDPIEELGRYGAAVEDATAATAVEVLVGDAPARSIASDEMDLVQSPTDAGRGRRPWLIAAAVAVIVALGAAALVTRPDDDDRDDLEVVDDPAGETFGYAPGWHELDPGPLSPRRGASVTWTGEELIVLGGESETDGAAYDPAARAWRAIAPSPFELAKIEGPEGLGPSAAWSTAWTGEELIAVVRSGIVRTSNPPQRGGQAAAYDPAADSWRSLPPPPMWLLTTSADAVWTGEEAVFLDVLAAYSPSTHAWRELPPPPAAASPVPRGLADAYEGTWTGAHVVFAAPGEPTVAYDPATDSWVEHEPAPLLDGADREELPLERAPTAGIGSTDDLAAMATCTGDGAALDLATWAWTERDLPLDITVDCQPNMWSLGGRLVTDLKTGRFVHHDGQWQRFDVEGWVPTQRSGTASTGDVLFSWASTEVIGFDQSTSTVVQSSPTFGVFVPYWLSEPDEPPSTHAPTDTVTPTDTSPPISTSPTDPAVEAPAMTITVGDQTIEVPAGAPRCDGGPGLCVDARLQIESGGPIYALLPGDDWSITDATFTWRADGRFACDRIGWSPEFEDALPHLSRPPLVPLWPGMPQGTHMIRIEAEVAGRPLEYWVVLDNGDVITCDLGVMSYPPATYDYEYFGLTREEAIEKAGDGNWRDISDLSWDELIGRSADATMGQVDFIFVDGQVRFAELWRSGLPNLVEGFEHRDDVTYVGRMLDEAIESAEFREREHCVVGDACEDDLDPERLQLHVDEQGQGTTVIGVTRR